MFPSAIQLHKLAEVYILWRTLSVWKEKFMNIGRLDWKVLLRAKRDCKTSTNMNSHMITSTTLHIQFPFSNFNSNLTFDSKLITSYYKLLYGGIRLVPDSDFPFHFWISNSEYPFNRKLGISSMHDDSYMIDLSHLLPTFRKWHEVTHQYFLHQSVWTHNTKKKSVLILVKQLPKNGRE